MCFPLRAQNVATCSELIIPVHCGLYVCLGSYEKKVLLSGVTNLVGVVFHIKMVFID